MKNIILIILILISFSSSAQKAEIFQKDGFAIRGYDAVAFFTESKAVKGDSLNMLEWRNAKWLFSSRQNLDAFRLDPEKYAPQYGGYCAYGTAEGHKAPTDAGTWTIINDKLYFNYNGKVKELWSKKTKEYIEKADENWPQVKDKE